MAKPIYTASNGRVWKESVETKHVDGSSSFTLGFVVCNASKEIGDEGAANLAMMLNIAEQAETEAAIKAKLLSALRQIENGAPFNEMSGCRTAEQGYATEIAWMQRAARAAIAAATGAAP